MIKNIYRQARGTRDCEPPSRPDCRCSLQNQVIVVVNDQFVRSMQHDVKFVHSQIQVGSAKKWIQALKAISPQHKGVGP